MGDISVTGACLTPFIAFSSDFCLRSSCILFLNINHTILKRINQNCSTATSVHRDERSESKSSRAKLQMCFQWFYCKRMHRMKHWNHSLHSEWKRIGPARLDWRVSKVGSGLFFFWRGGAVIWIPLCISRTRMHVLAANLSADSSAQNYYHMKWLLKFMRNTMTTSSILYKILGIKTISWVNMKNGKKVNGKYRSNY